MITLQNKLSAASKKHDIGKTFLTLIEGASKRSSDNFSGRTSQNKVVVFPASQSKKGDYVNVLVEKSTSATLIGRIVG